MTQISVIIPTFQVEPYIARLVRALAAQTFQDFDVIVVDDASLDRSAEIAEYELRAAGLEHVVLTHPVNRGVAAARNSGVEATTSPFHICIDPDDVLHPRFLEVLWRGVEQFDAKISACGFSSITADEPPTAKHFRVERLTRADALHSFLLRTRQFISPAMLVDTKFVRTNSLDYPEGVLFAEDIEWIWRTLLAAPNVVAYSRAPLYGYVVRPGSTMRSSDGARIQSGYVGLSTLARTFDETVPTEVRRWMLSRWTLGALRSSSKMLSENEFVTLAADWDSRGHAINLLRFPDPKVRLLGAMLLVSPRLFYRVVGRLR